jgi:hypothetical protein
MDETGERDTLIETITHLVLQELARTVVTREMAIEVLREIAGEDQP